MYEPSEEEWQEYEDDQYEHESTVAQWQHYEETMAESKRDFLNELVKENHLNLDEDIFKRNLGNKEMAFITRTGIEKIQYNNDIRVRYEVIAMQPDYVVVKAIATKGPHDDINDIVVESFGEATPENTKQKPPYYSAMAEKRALARVVLKMCGAYKHGVYGEDEADDFKRPSHNTSFSEGVRGPDAKKKVA